MIGQARAVALTGLAGHVIDVEAHVAPALPAFTIVGLPDASLSEARDRVRAAVASSGLTWPNRRITVNLTPASLPKTGSATDLAIAVAVLASAGLIEAGTARNVVHLGELGLDGRVRPVRGVLPAVAAAVEAGMPRVVVPAANAAEAALVPGAQVVAAENLAQVARRYGNDHARPAPGAAGAPAGGFEASDGAGDQRAPTASADVPEMADVRGQADARWALEVAAAGAHHLLMTGPPGTGKTMLATRLPGILPDLRDSDAVAATSIHSLAGTFVAERGLLRRPPFEAPHHSASAAAIVGGGAALARPGAISRAHAGVLFLDEAPEFPARVLQTLRQPLESGEVVLHRAFGAVRYPARFQLVMAANPCPCGRADTPGKECTCAPIAKRRYAARLSGPLLDRVDMQVTVLPAVRGDDDAGESTARVRERVERARALAAQRLGVAGWATAAQATGRWLADHTPRAALRDLNRALDHGAITARGRDRVTRVAWTLAFLDGRDEPTTADLGAAMTLRGGGGAWP